MFSKLKVGTQLEIAGLTERLVSSKQELGSPHLVKHLSSDSDSETQLSRITFPFHTGLSHAFLPPALERMGRVCFMASESLLKVYGQRVLTFCGMQRLAASFREAAEGVFVVGVAYLS